MAAYSNGTGGRRRWVFTLSGVAALAVMAIGVVLWQVVERSSLSVVTQRVDQAKPLLGGSAAGVDRVARAPLALAFTVAARPW